MATVEIGYFAILIGFALFFTFGSFKTLGKVRSGFFVTGMTLWLGLGILMSGGYDVATTTTHASEFHYNATGHMILNITKGPDTQVFISGVQSGAILSYVFFILAVVCFLLTIVSIYQGGK